jgi:hypothetical protein
MKPDPPPSDVSQSKDIADLPPKRKWFTPFLSLVGSEAFARRGGKSTLVYAIPDRSSAVYLDELRTLLAVAGVNARQVIMEDFEIR